MRRFTRLTNAFSMKLENRATGEPLGSSSTSQNVKLFNECTYNDFFVLSLLDSHRTDAYGFSSRADPV
jgi:hypothetical protein